MFGVWKTCVERESTKHPEIGLQVRKETGRDGNWGAAFDSATHRNYGLEQVTDPNADVSSFIQWNFRLGSPWANSSFHTLTAPQPNSCCLSLYGPQLFSLLLPEDMCAQSSALQRPWPSASPSSSFFFFCFNVFFSNDSFLCMCGCMHAQLWLTQRLHVLSAWDFPGKNTGVGCHFLL